MGQLDDIEQADVPLSTLDASHVVPVKVGQLRQLLLRKSAPEPKLADAPAEDCSGIEVRHPAIIRT
jgi:hypothetical protein